ncbi:MAG: hypothetical protein IJQ80_02730, partial [Clostridia bacterium]|nr:hypothetical protein [Clostridia bacterium]
MADNIFDINEDSEYPSDVNGDTLDVKGKSQMYETGESSERRAILVSAYDKRGEDEARISLEELGRLVDTAGGEVSTVITQMRDKPDGKTYIDLGSGIGVTAFGIGDEEWIQAVTAQLGLVQHTSNLYYTDPCMR